MGIRGRVILFMGLFSLLATALLAAVSYKLTERTAIDEAKAKGELLLRYQVAYGSFFQEKQRALIMELVEENRFYPELMSRFVAIRGIWDAFRHNNTGYSFKQASLDPLYPANRADKDEEKIIETFRRDAGLTRLDGIVDKDGERYLYLASPIRIEKRECLRCHGDPADAPRDQIEIYGTEHGYHWQENDTVSASVVYVSIGAALANAKRTAGILFLVMVAAFFVVLLSLLLFLDGRLFRPMERLSERVEELGRGERLGEPFHHGGDDEIGVLARSIEHLRQLMSRNRGGKQ